MTDPRFPGHVTIPPEAVGHLTRGHLIEAIKATRLATGLGLKEAKDAVDAYLVHHPSDRQQYQAATAGAAGRIWMVLGLVLVVCLIVAGILWSS